MNDSVRSMPAPSARAAGGSLLAGPTAKAEAIAGSEMAALVSEFDWASTPLGPAESWPQSLKSAVRLMLGSRYPMFIWWGPELVGIYNDAYCEVLGPRHPWALGRSSRETWAEIWDVIGSQIESVMQRGASTWNDRVLLPMQRKGYAEETYFTFSYSPCFNDAGEVGGVYCTCTDETSRVLGERRLKTLGDLSAAVLDSRNAQEACEAAVLSLSANTHDLPFVLLYLQDGSALQLAAGAGVQDERVAVLRARLDEPGMWPFGDVAANGEPLQVARLDQHARVPAGPWDDPVQDALVLPLPGPVGGTAGFMVAGLNPRRPLDAEYRDWLRLVAQQVASAIADARSFEEERLRSQSLAALDRAKTAFFSNVSHELRTPLALMLGPMGELLESGALDARARESLALAQRNGQRLQRLVNALLDFSRIEAGRMQACFQPMDLAAYTTELASFFDSAARKAGLVLDVRCYALPRPVYVDRAMWEKVVFNLLSNAIKYTLAGRVEVRLRAEGTVARLEVRDTGAGIPAEALPRVFERFFRVEGAQARTIEGSGIGLALVAELARMHGARIDVQSRVGEGSTFRVDLPWGHEHLPAAQVAHEEASFTPSMAAAGWIEEVESWLDMAPPPEDGSAITHDEHADIAAPAAPAIARRGSVLLVDDNADMRHYLGRLLGREHEVRTAADGWQALSRIDDRLPDLVLTDVMMGGMDGFELLRRLREDPATATLPVIMLSANAGEEARLRALEAGADDFLVKPFHARELLARVSGAMRLAHVRQQAMRREQELRSEVERVMESITEGFVAVDADWRFTYVNRAAEALYGRPRENLLGCGLWDIFPEVASSAFEEPFRRAMCERVALTVEGPYNPLAAWFEVNIYPVASGGLSLYFRDVLQTRLMERSIRESEAQQRFLAEFDRLMRHLDDPEEVLHEAVRAIGHHLGADRCIWALVDADGDGAEVRGEFRRGTDVPSMLGRIRLSQVGTEHLRLYRAGRPFVSHDVATDDRAADGRDRYRQAGIQATISCGILRGDRLVAGIGVHQREPRHWIESEVQLVQAAGQRCWEAFERAQVQRRQREDAEALGQAHAALQQVERRKDQFIATLAHELRNPLAPLRNGVQLLALGGGPDGGARVQAMMRRQIDHLVRLVDDLLEVSRITSGKVVLQRARLSLHEVLMSAAESCRPVVEAARHSLHVDVDAVARMDVDGDPMRLAQVFTNLLNNAAKYTEPGGHIAMSAHGGDGEAIVRVQDNGMGLAPEMLEEVFQPFVQVDRSAARAQGGLGIGLSIVRSLVELHGGRVQARSDGLGRGSLFEVRLPLAEGSLAQPPERRASSWQMPSDDGPLVLVVDDNRDAADSLAAMLEMMGARARVVYGGPDALTAVDQHRPQLVLLDLGMPGMDGYEVASRLANHPRRAQMHVVALTGWGQAEDRQRTREAGFDDHIVKPAEIEVLEAVLAKVGGTVRA